MTLDFLSNLQGIISIMSIDLKTLFSLQETDIKRSESIFGICSVHMPFHMSLSKKGISLLVWIWQKNGALKKDVLKI